MSRRACVLIACILLLAAGGFLIQRDRNAVDWQGNIIGVMVGGEGLAVRRTDGTLFQAYLPPGQVASISSGPVRIIGRITGTDCAYANTVFSGRCTPTVDVDELLKMK